MVGRSRVSELSGHGQSESLEVVWPADRQDVFLLLAVLWPYCFFLFVITDCFSCLLVLATVLYFCLKSLDCSLLFE